MFFVCLEIFLDRQNGPLGLLNAVGPCLFILSNNGKSLSHAKNVI